MLSAARARRFVLWLSFTVFSLTAAAPAQTAGWKTYGSTTEGFRALFPSEPQASKSSIPVNGGTFELRSYIAQVGSTALYVGVCDYGAKGVSTDPESLLASAKKGATEHLSAHILSEKKIDLDSNPGLGFEAESEKLHFTVHMYVAGSVLYQVMVATPIGEKFATGADFFDSFELLGKQPVAAGTGAPKPPEWKSYRYASDGFSVSFPSAPSLEKQIVATDAGNFELRTYVSEDTTATLITAVCDYGASAAAKGPENLLQNAKTGAIENLKARLISEKKTTAGSNPGLVFEADNETQHISAQMLFAGTTLYQTIVVAPIRAHYAEAQRFLDSFTLIDRSDK